MWDKQFYMGYEGEDAVSIWTEDGAKIGLIIWRGFFETILECCFKKDFSKNGIVECYYHQNGFYDEKWEMQDPTVVLSELAEFDDTVFGAQNKEMIQESKTVAKHLASFIKTAMENNQTVYVEYT